MAEEEEQEDPLLVETVEVDELEEVPLEDEAEDDMATSFVGRYRLRSAGGGTLRVLGDEEWAWAW